MRPEAVAFDVNETLFSMEALRTALTDVGAPDGTLTAWFDRVLRDGFALAAAGDFVEFGPLAHTTLTRLLGDADAAATVLDAFAHLEPHPDVEPALRRLTDAGVAVVTMTNGHAATTRGLLERAGLDGLVARCLDVTGPRVWKPAARAYRWCAEQVPVRPERLALVAVHGWDVHGASRAGLLTGYARRHEGGRADHFAAAVAEADDLVGVVEELLARPDARGGA